MVVIKYKGIILILFLFFLALVIQAELNDFFNYIPGYSGINIYTNNILFNITYYIFYIVIFGFIKEISAFFHVYSLRLNSFILLLIQINIFIISLFYLFRFKKVYRKLGYFVLLNIFMYSIRDIIMFNISFFYISYDYKEIVSFFTDIFPGFENSICNILLEEKAFLSSFYYLLFYMIFVIDILILKKIFDLKINLKKLYFNKVFFIYFSNVFILTLLTKKSYLLSYLTIFLISPIIEELVFRKLILDGLKDKMNYLALILLTPIIFLLVHANKNIINYMQLYFLAVILNIVYLKKKNVVYTSIFHSLWNIVFTIF